MFSVDWGAKIERSRWSCLTIQFPVHVHFWPFNRPLIDGGAVFHGVSWAHRHIRILMNCINRISNSDEELSSFLGKYSSLSWMFCQTVDNLCLYKTEANPRPCDSSLPFSWLISEGGNIELDHHSLMAISFSWILNQWVSCIHGSWDYRVTCLFEYDENAARACYRKDFWKKIFINFISCVNFRRNKIDDLRETIPNEIGWSYIIGCRCHAPAADWNIPSRSKCWTFHAADRQGKSDPSDGHLTKKITWATLPGRWNKWMRRHSKYFHLFSHLFIAVTGKLRNDVCCSTFRGISIFIVASNVHFYFCPVKWGIDPHRSRGIVLENAHTLAHAASRERKRSIGN